MLQRLHCLVRLLQDLALAKIFQEIAKSFFWSFSCQRCLLSSVSFFLLSWLNDIRLFCHVVLNSVAVRPTYVLVLSAVVTVAWYTTSLTKHCPLRGHLSGSLQLQGLSPFSSGGLSGLFRLRMVLLCPSMICYMFGEQLWLSLKLFLLNSFLNLWFCGKHFSIKFRNSLPILVCTFLLNGGLSHIMFLCLFLLLVVDSGGYCGGVNLRVYE